MLYNICAARAVATIPGRDQLVAKILVENEDYHQAMYARSQLNNSGRLFESNSQQILNELLRQRILE